MSLLAHHREDSYRSLPGSPYPGTPYAMDRAVMTSRDVEDAMQFARAGIDGDYFAGTPRYAGSLRSRSPYGGMEHEQNGGAYHHDMCMQDLIRRTNLAVTLANSSIKEKAQYSLIHPMMTRDGRFPQDFQQPKTVEAFKVLDGSQLDRILQAYMLPLDLRAVSKNPSRSTISASEARSAKLLVLYEFLGATRLLEYEKLKRMLY